MRNIRIRERTNDQLPGQILKRKKYIFASLILICAGFDWCLLCCCEKFLYLLLCDAPYLPEKYAQEYTHIKTLRTPSSQRGRSDIASIAFSPDNKTIAAVARQAIYLWDVKTGNLLSTLKTHPEHIHAIAFSPDGQTVASVSSRGPAPSPSIEMQMNETLFNPVFEPTGLSVAMQELFFIYRVRMWDVKTATERFTFPAETLLLTALEFSPDGSQLLLTTHSGFREVYHATTGEHLRQRTSVLAYNVMRNTYALKAFSFSPDGKIFASGGRDRVQPPLDFADAAIQLWDINTGLPIQILKIPGGRIHLLAFSPDSKILASTCGYDFRRCHESPNKIHIWDVENQNLLSIINVGDVGERGILTLRFALDNMTLASGHINGTVHLWDITGRTIFK